MEAAITAFRQAKPQIKRLYGFGNCDAATALGLFGGTVPFQGLILANPWTFEEAENGPNRTGSIMVQTDTPPTHSPAMIRARYWTKIRNPDTYLELAKGKINLRNTIKNINQLSKKEKINNISIQLYQALSDQVDQGCQLNFLLAKGDRAAQGFLTKWDSKEFSTLRNNPQVTMSLYDTSSHSFAEPAAKKWLFTNILSALKTG